MADEDTVLLFRRNDDGRAFRRRAVADELTDADLQEIPACFHPLLRHIKAPTSGQMGKPVQHSDYTSVVDTDGNLWRPEEETEKHCETEGSWLHW
jgi:hypothetical protein